MKKHLFALFCVFAVVMVFAVTASSMQFSMVAGAEESSSATTKKQSANEVPVVEPVDPKPTDPPTQPPMPTKKEPATDPTKATDPTNTTDPAKPTDKPNTSEKNDPSEPASEKPTPGTTKKPTTTKNNNRKTTTTRRYIATTAAPRVTAPRMTVPQVQNTQIEGTTLSPLDAYFERISGMTNANTTAAAEELVVSEMEEENGHNLSTTAIVAICLGGIALVTVGLTAVLAIRNKHSGAPAQEADSEILEDYPVDTDYASSESEQPTKVDQNDTFTVVSLDDKDYKD